MTPVEGERLAVLEVKVSDLQTDVTEIKTDIKTLIRVQQAQDVASAVERAAESAHRKSRGDLGVWVRASIPWIIASGALVLGVVNFIFGLLVGRT